ncbi:COG1361 S-layer family protein [Methanimicrococcus blatticola]|uniref:Uncharacterized protein n=1 Tax=Methanimicrococcus blatticola TaxID=91560 RepID=A0A484F7V3_9EURY|nr:COG1361 S-layer family protein [Methanimicrococcus blatticola]MBZ3935132.1 hypothetical protein [Methanimicrococcus blatticola]MCC2508771.1 COG1361 S-layer family protein [Methanimicrococcus blatticola]TDQ71195.1 hypothetical protein C7391_0299 [Methanimicrococcus blatticola]
MTKNKTISAVGIFLAAMLLISSFPISAAATPFLELTLIDQTPYPAQPGQQVRFWIQAENMGGGSLNNVTIQVVPNAPFSAASGEASKTFNAIYSGSKVYHEYVMYVDKDAPSGNRDLTVRYKTNNSSVWYETKFKVNIGGIVDTDSRGTLIIENITSNPEVFMPGDEGVIWVILKNNASEQTVSLSNKSYAANARIQSASLYSKDGITVKSDTVSDLGIIMPGDNISIPFRISVPEDTKAGTYFLTLNVTGSSYEYNIRRNIEIKVDSDGVKTIQSKEAKDNGTDTVIEIDVVNYHQGTVRGVSIIPAANNTEFYPKEYFIGEMKPDDLYTAKFIVKQKKSADNNITFTSAYYNGDNAHDDDTSLYMTVAKTSSGISLTTMIIIAILVLIAGGAVAYYFYDKKKKSA